MMERSEVEEITQKWNILIVFWLALSLSLDRALNLMILFIQSTINDFPRWSMLQDEI